ncbi:MAG: hypothetical protein ACD_79C00287G0027 [uncultured bacterium]|nr:MAG: hypothetical protein ACD_79C00287G0027 [uncultured bacterium]
MLENVEAIKLRIKTLKDKYCFKIYKTFHIPEFLDPKGITLDNNKNIFISDALGNKVFRISFEGLILSEFSKANYTIPFMNIVFSNLTGVLISYFDKGGIGIITDDSIEDWIKINERCAGMCLSPDGSLYVCFSLDNKILKIRNKKIETIIDYGHQNIFSTVIGVIGNEIGLSVNNTGEIFKINDNGNLTFFSKCNDFPFSSFKTFEDKVYILSARKFIFCYNLNGKLNWQIELEKIGIVAPKDFDVQRIDGEPAMVLLEHTKNLIHFIKLATK